MPPLIFRKGLDLKHEVAGVLAESYHSDLVDAIKEAGFRHQAGRLTIHLAREFGFCYGVDRAVDYAYQARRRFPDSQVYLTGEIIHNPHVNDQLRAQGIRRIYCSGVSTQAVVQATVRDGHDRDYEMIVLEDCCAAHSAEEHANSIGSLKRFCTVTTSAEVAFC